MGSGFRSITCLDFLAVLLEEAGTGVALGSQNPGLLGGQKRARVGDRWFECVVEVRK